MGVAWCSNPSSILTPLSVTVFWSSKQALLFPGSPLNSAVHIKAAASCAHSKNRARLRRAWVPPVLVPPAREWGFPLLESRFLLWALRLWVLQL